MNKKIQKYFENLNLTIEKNGAYGIVNDYLTSFFIDNFDHTLYFHISFYSDKEVKVKIIDEINDQMRHNFELEPLEYGIKGSISILTFGFVIKKLNEMLPIIIEKLNLNEIGKADKCPKCGIDIDSFNSKLCSMNNFKITFDTGCVGKINQEIALEDEKFAKLRINYPKAFLGAVIGALVGGVIAYILSCFDLISQIGAVVSVYIGTYLYQKFGGKPDKLMFITVFGITTSIMTLFIFGEYLFVANELASNYGFNSGGFAAFRDMMTIDDFSSEFTMQIILNLIFIVFGSIYEIISIARKNKRLKKIE